jgi:hypothetical protein
MTSDNQNPWISSNHIYSKFVDEYNQKENDLLAKIKFYKENKHQLLRIKMLEAELESLQTDLNTEHAIKMREMEENKKKDEYIKIISENCKDAFQMYQLNKRNFRNSNTVQICTLCKTYYINYTFTEINENRYKVSTNVPNYGWPNNGKIMNGIYDKEKGILSDLI